MKYISAERLKGILGKKSLLITNEDQVWNALNMHHQGRPNEATDIVIGRFFYNIAAIVIKWKYPQIPETQQNQVDIWQDLAMDLYFYYTAPNNLNTIFIRFPHIPSTEQERKKFRNYFFFLAGNRVNDWMEKNNKYSKFNSQWEQQYKKICEEYYSGLTPEEQVILHEVVDEAIANMPKRTPSGHKWGKKVRALLEDYEQLKEWRAMQLFIGHVETGLRSTYKPDDKQLREPNEYCSIVRYEEHGTYGKFIDERAEYLHKYLAFAMGNRIYLFPTEALMLFDYKPSARDEEIWGEFMSELWHQWKDDKLTQSDLL